MDDSCEQAVADNRQGVVHRLRCLAGDQINSMLRNVTQGLGIGLIPWNDLSNGEIKA
jgi:hypothetical protein